MSDAPAPPDDPNSDADPFGRVGYGRLARYSPLILGLVIIAAVAYIALNQADEGPQTGDMVGEPAPDVTLIPLDGQPFALSSLRGNVVVLNFWAAWCDPCKVEMPEFQAIHAEGVADVRIIGVDIKNDRVDAARDLITETGVTYQIVRDGGGEHQLYGPIEQALGIGGTYPMSVFIRPDGVIDSVRIGQLAEIEIRDGIADARN